MTEMFYSLWLKTPETPRWKSPEDKIAFFTCPVKQQDHVPISRSRLLPSCPAGRQRLPQCGEMYSSTDAPGRSENSKGMDYFVESVLQ